MDMYLYTSVDYYFCFIYLMLSVPETIISEFASSVDPNEVAHEELPHLDLHCLLISLQMLNLLYLRKGNF